MSEPRSPFDWLRANGKSEGSEGSNDGLEAFTITDHPFDTVRPEALEGTNGAQDRPELVE
jgi:hypothetical protein